MPKDAIKDGMNFALGVIKISGQNFNKAVKKLEKKHKLSTSEGELMVYGWLAEQQKQLEAMRKKLKKKALKKGINKKEIAQMERVIQAISKQISMLEKKKKGVKKAGSKKKKR